MSLNVRHQLGMRVVVVERGLDLLTIESGGLIGQFLDIHAVFPGRNSKSEDADASALDSGLAVEHVFGPHDTDGGTRSSPRRRGGGITVRPDARMGKGASGDT